MNFADKVRGKDREKYEQQLRLLEEKASTKEGLFSGLVHVSHLLSDYSKPNTAIERHMLHIAFILVRSALLRFYPERFSGKDGGVNKSQ